jgi:hypothetical protein
MPNLIVSLASVLAATAVSVSAVPDIASSATALSVTTASMVQILPTVATALNAPRALTAPRCVLLYILFKLKCVYCFYEIS